MQPLPVHLNGNLRSKVVLVLDQLINSNRSQQIPLSRDACPARRHCLKRHSAARLARGGAPEALPGLPGALRERSQACQ